MAGLGLVLLLLAWVSPIANAAAVDTVRFRTFGPDQGLSQISATDVLEDRLGFLWVATQDGLNRFDGYGFRVYRNAVGDTNSLSDNYVLALAEDSDGGIWAGTQNGLNRLDPVRDRIERFAAGSAAGALRDGQVTAIHAGEGSAYQDLSIRFLERTPL